MAAAFHIRVETGPHAGAVAQVEGQAFTAGAAAGNDIVLLGSDMAAEHFRVERVRRPLRRLRVAAVGGAVLVNGRTGLAAGQWTLARSPLQVAAGSQSFTISLPGWRDRMAAGVTRMMTRLSRI